MKYPVLNPTKSMPMPQLIFSIAVLVAGFRSCDLKIYHSDVTAEKAWGALDLERIEQATVRRMDQ